MSWKTPPRGVPAFAIATLLALLVIFPSAASARSLQFGAWTPGDPYYGNTNGADALEAATGRRVDIVNWYQSWGGGDWVSSVQPHVIGAVTGGGRTPMLTWEPWAPGSGATQPAYRLARIAGGDFDAYIARWARSLRALRSTIYVRPMHEMNGNWYPWSGAVNGNSPALYVRAWRRMVNIFRRGGASNVRFVWSPNNVDVPASNTMERYYPGASYVDVLAVDGYNWGAATPGYGGWQSFSKVFMGAYHRLRALGPQPIWIAEIGTSADGGDKAAWIRDMFVRARSMDRLQAIVWFNENKERDWRATPTPEIAAAFAPGADTRGSRTKAVSSATAKRRKPKLTNNRRARVGRAPAGGRRATELLRAGTRTSTAGAAGTAGRTAPLIARSRARVGR